MDEKRARYLLDFAEGQGLLDRRGGFTHYEPDMADYRKLMDDLKPYISKRGAIFVFTDRKQSFHVLDAIEDTAYVAKSGFPSRFPGPMGDFVICAAYVMGKELPHPVSAPDFMLAFPQKAGLKEEDILRTSRCLAIKDMKDLHSAVNLAMQTPGEYTCAALQKAIGKVVFSSLFYNTWEAESLHSFLLSAENPLERIGLLSSLLSTEDDVRKEAFQVLFARQKGGQEASMEPHSERGTAG